MSITEAAAQGDVAAIDGFGGDVNELDGAGKSALMYAASNGMKLAVEKLIAKSADVNLKSSKGGNTALQGAAFIGHIGIVKMLLDAGADKAGAKEDCELGSSTTHRDHEDAERGKYAECLALL